MGWQGFFLGSFSSLISHERLGVMLRFQHFLPGRQASPDCIPPLRQTLASAEYRLSGPQIVSRGLGGDRGRVTHWGSKRSCLLAPTLFWLQLIGIGLTLAALGPSFPQEDRLDADNVQEPGYPSSAVGLSAHTHHPNTHISHY